MKIAFIGQKGIPVSQGGVERHAEELARKLAEKGHDVLVYARSTYLPGPSELPKNIRIITVPSVPFKAWDSIVGTFLATVDVLFRKVDVIHFHHMGPAFFMFLPKIFKPSAKIILTHHSDWRNLPYWGLFARLSFWIGEQVGVRLSDELIVINEAMAKDIKNRYGRDSSVIPNGVTNFTEAEDFSLDLPEKYVLAVSRIIRAKGLDSLINAFNLIAADYPEHHLVIVGGPTQSDNDLPRLRKLAASNHRIHFLGQQPSKYLGEIYRRAQVFVQASEVEGLPITLLEAASMSLPVLSSDIPEHTDIVRADGLTFKTKNPIDLAAKLRYLISNLSIYRKVARRLSHRILSEYNWSFVAERVEKVY